MARNEQPKEDLIRDATALTERFELQIVNKSGPAQIITIGWRTDGAASLFFGEEPVYHFNADGQLRRAYHDGLIKSDKGRLVRMRRNRTANEVQLLSVKLSDQEQAAFLADLTQRCDSLAAAMKTGTAKITRQFPETPAGDLLKRCQEWLGDLKHPVAVASRPNAS